MTERVQGERRRPLVKGVGRADAFFDRAVLEREECVKTRDVEIVGSFFVRLAKKCEAFVGGLSGSLLEKKPAERMRAWCGKRLRELERAYDLLVALGQAPFDEICEDPVRP